MTVLLLSLLLHSQRRGEMVILFLFNPRFPCFDFPCPSLLLCSFLLYSFFIDFIRKHRIRWVQVRVKIKNPVAKNPKHSSQFQPLNCRCRNCGVTWERDQKFKYHISFWGQTDVSWFHILIHLFAYSSFNSMSPSFLPSNWPDFKHDWKLFISHSLADLHCLPPPRVWGSSPFSIIGEGQDT